MVYVSHDAAELRQLATQIVMLKQRPGDRARRRQGAAVERLRLTCRPLLLPNIAGVAK